MSIPIEFFNSEYAKKPQHERLILELGTRRWGKNPTHHQDWFKPYLEYVMLDNMAGEDVDVLGDAHKLSVLFPEESFNVVVSCSTFEHLHSPWIAAKEILKVLKPGGLFYIQTHFCFPEHGYPNDYFRYTRKGLESLFITATTLHSCYEFKATLTPINSTGAWDDSAPNWLNVCVVGKK